MFKGQYNRLLIAGALLFMAAVLVINSLSSQSPADLTRLASQRLGQKLEACAAALPAIQSPSATISAPAREAFNRNQVAIYLLKNDTLQAWNNSQWPLEYSPRAFDRDTGMVKFSYGWLVYLKTRQGPYTVLALTMIKPDYKLQNNYLSNQFVPWLGLPPETEIQWPAKEQNKITINKTTFFSFNATDPVYYDNQKDTTHFWLFTLAYILLLLGILLNIRQGVSVPAFLILVFSPLLLRAFMLWSGFPAFFSRTVFYDPRLFGNADSLLNGFLGDLLYNSLTLLFIAVALHFHNRRGAGTGAGLAQMALQFTLSFVVCYQFNKTIGSIVNNSTFSFDFLNILNIHPLVAFALAPLAFLALALHAALGKAWLLAPQIKNGKIVFAGLLLCLPPALLYSGCSATESVWVILFALSILLFTGRGQGLLALGLGLQVLLLALVSSYLLNGYMQKNQALDFSVLMQKLGERQDQILESEYSDLPRQIKQDENLNNLLEFLPVSEKEFQQSLRQNYFNGYFNRYDIQFSAFDKNCHYLLNTDDPVLLNEGYFLDRFEYKSVPVSKGLYFVSGFHQHTQYLFKIELGNYRLYARLNARQYEEAGSFPDLFLDRALQKQEKLRNLSYAVYRQGQSTNRFGDFNYPFYLSDSTSLSKSSPGYLHYYFEPEDGTKVIISRPSRNWAYFFTFNSYLLLFFSLLTYLAYLAYAFFYTAQFQSASLTRRIQAIIIVLLLVAMSAVSITSGKLVSGQFDTGNRRQLEEKTRVIVSELSTQSGSAGFFEETQKELINARIREYSRLFNTPVSLFTRSGRLFTTSEPKLYDFGLAAPYLNPKAYEELSQNLSSAVGVSDKAGSLNYLSLYTPLFDSKKQLSGFINLPYFAKQSDLSNELSEIISALINVYVILFVLSIVAGLILSGYITQPLRLIKQQIARITLDQKNEKISWQSNDEIGRLVSEYNQMLLKLEESAVLLAKSERESAWREMAKQVAHEIKNPLTPMKLNLQYLQHLMKSNPDDFKERFAKASAGIIEQIDSLAAIATEFSNFARLPGASLQLLNLAEIMSAAVHVFEGEKQVKIIHHLPALNCLAMCDREQCLRVFNNILKNAVQATDGVEEATIEITYRLGKESITVIIRDNGCGIDDALKPKLFSPNFTTKSTGTGLGLAMVKNSMEGFGGSVSFESEKNKGATFYLNFQVIITLFKQGITE